ncbi:TolC family protein [Xanthovirga aplysinae]|uniref:TolC family protein n=1 Tax=Xanthovirga aplysinae TaxID=2529853 RepID=UPI0012BD0C68|nr:TolC family protein [Xanthovirga aplysinae]MTI30788.1 TolC family protein [Xanthovirga aplysinae]
MNKPIFLISFLILFLFGQTTLCQENSIVSLKLSEVILLARENSLGAQQASTRLDNKFWQYRTFKAGLLPQISLNATLPDFSRIIDPVIQDDGSQQFREVSRSITSAGLSLFQNIGLTGGQIFLRSDLQRIDNIAPYTDYSYSSVPVTIGLSQPLFSFNSYRWDKRIEPLRYEESQRSYVEEMEEVSEEAVSQYFELLLAQVGLDIAEKNVANNDTLYKIAVGRYNLGKIAENELLQLELSLMNARQKRAETELDVELNTLELKTFLNLDVEKLHLFLPELIPAFEVDEELALDEARKNRSDLLAFKRMLLESDKEVAKAKGEAGLNVNLFASYGLTQQANNLEYIYSDPQDQQQVRLGLQVPLLDWGLNKSKIKTAEANASLIRADVRQQEENFDREVFLLVKQFKMQRSQLTVAKKSDEIAQKRYDIAKNRYLIGKIGITDLNIATEEKDRAKQSYISSLRNFWTTYYKLRRLTLYDFERGVPLFTE